MANVEIQWDFDRAIKDIGLKAFVMVQNHAKSIRWENHDRFIIRIGIRYLMKDA